MVLIVPSNDDFGQGPRRCRAVGGAAIECFAGRLKSRARDAALRAEDIEEELRAYLDDAPEEAMSIFRQAYSGCGRRQNSEHGRKRRSHIFMRALVMPLEPLLRMPDAHGVMLPRCCILGFGYAMTKILGPQTYTRFHTEARAVGEPYGGSDEMFRDPRMRDITETALVRMADWFRGDFMLRLRDFIMLVNQRLSPTEAGSWEESWQMERASALVLLDALFRELREDVLRTGGDHIAARHGAEALATLNNMFAGIEGARRIIDKPWRLRPIAV